MDHASDPGGIVDDDLEVVVAVAPVVTMGRGSPVYAVATTSRYASELLVVLVDELAGMLALVADRDTGGLVGIGEPTEAVALEDLADRRAGMAQEWCQAVWPEAAADPGADDPLFGLVAQVLW